MDVPEAGALETCDKTCDCRIMANDVFATVYISSHGSVIHLADHLFSLDLVLGDSCSLSL